MPMDLSVVPICCAFPNCFAPPNMCTSVCLFCFYGFPLPLPCGDTESQPLWQPPPTAHLPAPGAASGVPSLVIHPWGLLPASSRKAEWADREGPCGEGHSPTNYTSWDLRCGTGTGQTLKSCRA